MNMRCVAGIAGAVALSASGIANADMIPLEGLVGSSTEGLGSFSGTLTYTNGPEADAGTLTFSLTNTSPVANGGFLTGFVFNVHSTDPAATVSLTSADFPFLGLTSVSAAPFGTFDGGAALGGSFLGGGSPRVGIGVGETGTFRFLVSASDAASLSAGDFVRPDSGNAGPDYDLVVRFRGFVNGGSDKLPGHQAPSPAGSIVVGLTGLAVCRRRR